MKLVVAVKVSGTEALAAAVAFEDWAAAEPVRTVTTRVADLAPPAKGAPDDRANVAIVALLGQHGAALQPELLVLEGFVHLDPQETPGPGRHLFDALGGRLPVIGLSRRAMAAPSPQFEVHREDETPPLIVTCAGIDLGAAKGRVRAMHGRKRVPTLVKLAARLVKPDAAD